VLRTVTKKDTLNATTQKFIRDIRPKMRKTGTSKNPKRGIGRWAAIKTSMWSIPIQSGCRKKINKVNRG
jgi:hypothetical protein